MGTMLSHFKKYILLSASPGKGSFSEAADFRQISIKSQLPSRVNPGGWIQSNVLVCLGIRLRFPQFKKIPQRGKKSSS